MKTKRIWELDALRGFCILCVIVIHFLFDLGAFTSIRLNLPWWYLLIKQYGGVIFVILSGLCATLGSKSFSRGLVVFGAGMLITLVTYAMVWTGMSDESIVVKFGVLHLLGVSMMLYGLYKKQKTGAILAQAITMIVLGYFFQTLVVSSVLLFPFGLCTSNFTSSDYFPILPNFGWFLLGVCIGRTLYKEKQSRLPENLGELGITRFFRFCGRQSLWIYLLHQPILFGIIQLISTLQK